MHQQSISKHIKSFSDKKIKFLVNELSLAAYFYSRNYSKAQCAIVGSEHGCSDAAASSYAFHGIFLNGIKESPFYDAFRQELRRRFGYSVSNTWVGWIGYNQKERQTILSSLDTLSSHIQGMLPMITSEQQAKEAHSALKNLGFHGTFINWKNLDNWPGFEKADNIFTDLSILISPKHKSSVENINKEQFTEVTIDKCESGIPIKGWENVCAALRLYSSGIPDSSNATQDEQLRSVASSQGIMGAGLLLMFQSKQDPNSFVDRMLKEASEHLKNSDSWNRDYDYDGQGVFFKTTVYIDVLNRTEDLYLLRFCAAYVGDKPEADLAKALNISRALVRVDVRVQTKPLNDLNFIFDFEDIIRTLDPVLHTLLYGENLAQYFIDNPKDAYGSFNPPVIYEEEGFVVTLAPGRVKSRFQYKDNVHKDTWQVVDDGILTGELYEGRNEDGSRKRDNPTFTIEISQPSGDRWNSNNYIYNEETKKKINSLAEQIAEAFKN
ncbi:MAG TPA: hypothetical protein PLI45_00125 [Candidatus Woesebacteria bacterium]|nr:hypothetical protein [Candidatus Woesebacteria bacterium]